jgi:hypothetical protein
MYLKLIRANYNRITGDQDSLKTNKVGELLVRLIHKESEREQLSKMRNFTYAKLKINSYKKFMPKWANLKWMYS